MVTTCAVCIAIGRNLSGILLPTTVNYRGYSLCVEHLYLWEANKEAGWDEIIKLANPSTVEVLKVEMPDDATTEEKEEILEEAIEEFNGEMGINSIEDLENEIRADHEERESLKEFDAVRAGGFKDPEDMMLARAMDANEPPQVTMSEKKPKPKKRGRPRKKKGGKKK